MQINYKYAIAAILSITGVYLMTRPNPNVRNNNPLNIKFNPVNDWVGQVGESGGFVVFDKPEHGFRAAYKLILLRRSEGRYSISDLIKKWSTTDQDEYIDYLSNKLDKFSWTPVFESEIPELMLHMSNFEGAKGAFSLSQVQQGISLA